MGRKYLLVGLDGSCRKVRDGEGGAGEINQPSSLRIDGEVRSRSYQYQQRTTYLVLLSYPPAKQISQNSTTIYQSDALRA